MSAKPWAIAGGGIAGLATAIGLAKIGRDVQVFEKTTVFAPIGAGLQLGPNAVRALQNLGVWDAVSPHCAMPNEIVVRDGLTGKKLQAINLSEKFTEKFGAPYRVILRADLHAALQNTCGDLRNIEIKMGSEWSGNLSEVEALIAADGIWSPSRSQYFQNAEAVILPQTIHRALVSVPANVDKDVVTLWLYPNGHAVHYVVGNPAKLNIVCVTKGLSNAGTWDQSTNPLTLVEYFKHADSELKTTLAHIQSWLSWPAAFVPYMPKWSKHNMLLIGDAAHATAPYLAQGAAMALEDAALLSQLAKNYWPVQEFFSQFEIARRPRTLHHHRAVLSNLKTYHASGVLRHARNFALQATQQDFFLQRLAWLYKH